MREFGSMQPVIFRHLGWDLVPYIEETPRLPIHRINSLLPVMPAITGILPPDITSPIQTRQSRLSDPYYITPGQAGSILSLNLPHHSHSFIPQSLALHTTILYRFMGQKLSAIHGVKSEDYDKPGNAINEIWLGDVEVISRLPFADSDMAQAAWPKGQFPKIPWHNFIIPWKRGVSTVERAVESSVIAARDTLSDSENEDLHGALCLRTWLERNRHIG
ncbi:hypothetical protein BO78DRAFT_470891 [Aspergillus sclerotiicarbonarius CBS 121057]|uniref:Uncharacterized protein n=1 Tax=Aspergillus sclerotiicarbonarius (strain CBS 121057 / IBT 28362) TaxID=1448318 RepID=A0A319E6K3_ASPSB|nr:hypothetical protein BO78DRAFT_470891 [Aspergillus sclerotiicarbonarius CBS 121057]